MTPAQDYRNPDRNLALELVRATEAAAIRGSAWIGRERKDDAGHDLGRVLEADDLVSGDNTCFVATGVTNGDLLHGVEKVDGVIRTESIVLRSRSRSRTVRRITAEYDADRWR